MKIGAYDYITKPFDPDEVLRTAGRAVEVSHLNREVERLRAKTSTAWDEESIGLIGYHPTMRELFKLIGKVAPSGATVLVTGESGTGKELVARAIHRHSPRAHRPLVTVNCAAIPEALLESELFGHERGAFTGATQAKPGRIELADGGTLFLDEVGDLPQFMAEGKFREDLFYRLNVVRIEVPPLRARRTDIPELAEHFLRRYRTQRADGPSNFSDEAMHVLLLYDYPGNVRELEHLIQRAVP
jgi:two-component system response regulator AtoC